MVSVMKYIAPILNAFAKLRVTVVVLIFLGFLAWTFKGDISIWMSSELETPPVEKTINRDLLIYGLLNDLLDEFDGGRAYVYTFHNGQNYLSKDPVLRHKQRSSMDYEVCAPGIKEIALTMQNIPTSIFARQIDNIIKEKVLGIARDSLQDLSARNVMSEIGSTHAAILPYRDNEGNITLMVGVDWVLAKEIFFSEDRFRHYVKNIGDIFMGYKEGTNLFSLREPQRSRGLNGFYYILDPEKEKRPIPLDGQHGHFLAGNMKLPKTNLYVSSN